MSLPLPDFTPADLPFVADGYDRRRDDRLDFPDDPRSEPDTEEVKTPRTRATWTSLRGSATFTQDYAMGDFLIVLAFAFNAALCLWPLDGDDDA